MRELPLPSKIMSIIFSCSIEDQTWDLPHARKTLPTELYPRPRMLFLALTLLHQCTERSSEFSENTQHVNNIGEMRLKEGADK